MSMDTAALRKSAQWKWVAVAAEKDDTRPILQCVLIEPKRIAACDGYRLRVARIETGVAEPTVAYARIDEPFTGTSKYPDIRRLWKPRDVRATLAIDAGEVLRLVEELLAAHKPIAKAARRGEKPIPLLYIKTRRRVAQLSRMSLCNWGPPEDIGLEVVRLGKCEGANIELAINAEWVRDALKGAGATTLEWCSAHHPVRFTQRGRYEVIMPLFLR